MRIGIVLPSAPAYSETFFSSKIEGLQANGHTVLIFANSEQKQKSDTSIVKSAPVLSGNKILVAFRSTFKLIQVLLFYNKASLKLYQLDRKDGVVFAQRIKNIIGNSHILSESLDWLHFGFGTMVFNRENVAKAMGAKMAVSFRGFDIGIYTLKHPDCYLKLWNKLDKIHVISDDIEALLFKNGFNGEAPVIKITPAIETSFFKPTKKEDTSSKINIVTIARLHWKKGLVYTLEALALLKNEGISFHYTIIGEGIEYERLKFAAYQLGIKEQVTFSGKLKHQQVKEILQKSDLYLQYSIQEGFCNAVLEAQAMGLLCVVSDAEGLSENVLDKKTGWVVPKRNFNLLYKTIKFVIDLDSEEKQKVIKKSKIRIFQEFLVENQQKYFIEFYE